MRTPLIHLSLDDLTFYLSKHYAFAFSNSFCFVFLLEHNKTCVSHKFKGLLMHPHSCQGSDEADSEKKKWGDF